MGNTYFQFKQFRVNQERCAMKVSTDACLFGAWVAANAGNAMNMLDIGAGTGLLMLMAAQKNNAPIDGIEIEEDCFAQLKKNLADSPWAGRLTPIHDDVREHVFPNIYDLIFSNPPFYEQQLNGPEAARNKAMHSTALSLQELFAVVSRSLASDGKFAVLLPYPRLQEAILLAHDKGLYPSIIVTVRHSQDHPWYRAMILFSGIQKEVNHREITIRANDEYSPGFKDLLDDYYLGS